MERWILAALIVLLGPLGAPDGVAAQEAEEIEALQLWLEEPLDLRRATVEDLELLPWLDRELAEAVVGLREHGGLEELEDLSRVPGLGPERRRALAPFVVLSGPRAFPHVELRRRSRWTPGRGVRPRDRVRAAWEPWRVALEGDESGPVRGAVGRVGRGAEIWAGALRIRLPWDLLWDDPLRRGRTGAPSPGVGFAAGPHASSLPGALRGGAVRATLLGGEFLSAVGRTGAGEVLRWLLAHDRAVGGGLRAGMAVRDGGWSSLWVAGRGEEHRWRVETVLDGRQPSAPPRLAAAVQLRRGAVRLGGSLAAAARRGPPGRGPVTGLALDRPHRVFQVHGAGRSGGLRLACLLRRVERDGVVRRRLEAEASGRLGEDRWALRLRADEEADADPTWTAALTVEAAAEVLGRPRLRLRRHRDAGREAFLLSLRWRGEGALRWSVETAILRGALASPWYAGLPEIGLEGRWGRGPALGLRGGLATKLGPAHPAAWGELLLPRGGPSEYRFGWQRRLELVPR